MKFEEEERTAKLSWERKEVEVSEDGGEVEVEYSVLGYCDEKPDGKEVYR